MAIDRAAQDNVSVTDDLELVTTYPRTAGMDVLIRGFELIMRVSVAEAQQVGIDMDVVVGTVEYKFVSMDMAITDAPFIKIEPDRPRYAPFLTVDDLETL